ncbi:uncharacterized protein LOC134530836 isoform X1 [Bacillus rossius redtenbacheri]|uniref:uncharacterized protein LOC134530836 isoform X1 n=1 Tax=Bacillus rossius redtenbacheri TaxID=93214 RepID=UPI002FDD309F
MADRGARCLLPLLLLLAATPGGSGAALNSSWWPCQQVAPQRDVQLQQVLGEWYLVEDISQIGSNAHYNMCVSMNLEQRAAGAELVMVGKEKPLGGQANYQNNTVLLSDRAGQQGLWEIPDVGMVAAVVYLQRDVLALAHCYPQLLLSWTAVFAREPHITPESLHAVNRALEEAGVPEMSTARLWDLTCCQPGD